MVDLLTILSVVIRVVYIVVFFLYLPNLLEETVVSDDLKKLRNAIFFAIILHTTTNLIFLIFQITRFFHVVTAFEMSVFSFINAVSYVITGFILFWIYKSRYLK